MRHLLILGALAALSACGETEAADPPEPPPTAPEPEHPEAPEVAPSPPVPVPPLEGLEGLEAEPTADELVPSAGVTDATPEGAHGCVLASETQTVLEHAGRTAIAAGYLGQLFVASYVRDASGEALAVARVLPGTPPELVTRIPIETPVAETARVAAPGLHAIDTSTLLIAVTDGAGRLLYTEISMADGGALGRFIARIDEAHADSRFSPAIGVSSDGTRVVAWTDGSGTPMRVRMARLTGTGSILGTEVISPDGGGAAPTWGLGEPERAFYFVEARIAMSVAHRVAIGADGSPGDSTVARPLLRGSDFPAIAVVRAPRGTRTHLAYSAVGNMASRAIGLVQSTGTDTALPLVPGLGYGSAITVRAAPLGASVVFAMEAPSAADPAAPHELRVRVAADDATLGAPLVLAGQSAPDVVNLGPLVAVSGHGARITFVRCSE